MMATAGIGGFAKGFASGMRLQSDMQDSEAKRGLMDLQRQSEELKIGREQQMADLSKNMGLEQKSFIDRAGEYEGLDDVKAADLNYTRMGALLKQQAAIAGKNPFEVDESINRLRKERFSERVMQGTNLLKAGDDKGFDVLKPVYNSLFKDGSELIGGKYNKDSDTFTLAYKDKDGVEQTRDVKREQFTEGMIPLALNAADAAKYMMQNKEMEMKVRENEKERTFRAGEGEKERSNRVGIAMIGERGANSRAEMGLKGTIYAADKGAESRSSLRQEGIDQKNLDDVQKEYNIAIGFTESRSGIFSPQEIAQMNLDRADAMQMYRLTKQHTNQNLTGSELRMLQDAVRSNKAKVKVDQASGLAVVEYNGVRAVVPASAFAPKQ
jgi:hypothetical protein